MRTRLSANSRRRVKDEELGKKFIELGIKTNYLYKHLEEIFNIVGKDKKELKKILKRYVNEIYKRYGQNEQTNNFLGEIFAQAATKIEIPEIKETLREFADNLVRNQFGGEIHELVKKHKISIADTFRFAFTGYLVNPNIGDSRIRRFLTDLLELSKRKGEPYTSILANTLSYLYIPDTSELQYKGVDSRWLKQWANNLLRHALNKKDIRLLFNTVNALNTLYRQDQVGRELYLQALQTLIQKISSLTKRDLKGDLLESLKNVVLPGVLFRSSLSSREIVRLRHIILNESLAEYHDDYLKKFGNIAFREGNKLVAEILNLPVTELRRYILRLADLVKKYIQTGKVKLTTWEQSAVSRIIISGLKKLYETGELKNIPEEKIAMVINTISVPVIKDYRERKYYSGEMDKETEGTYKELKDLIKRIADSLKPNERRKFVESIYTVYPDLAESYKYHDVIAKKHLEMGNYEGAYRVARKIKDERRRHETYKNIINNILEGGSEPQHFEIALKIVKDLPEHFKKGLEKKILEKLRKKANKAVGPSEMLSFYEVYAKYTGDKQLHEAVKTLKKLIER